MNLLDEISINYLKRLIAEMETPGLMHRTIICMHTDKEGRANSDPALDVIISSFSIYESIESSEYNRRCH